MVESLGVAWQCQAYSKEEPLGDLQEREPNYLVTGEDLKRIRMLNVFEPCTLQIGDRNYYTLKEKDVIMLRDEWKKLEKESYLKLEPNKQKNKKLLNTNIKKRPEHEDCSEEDEIEDSEVEAAAAASASATAEPMETDESKQMPSTCNGVVSPKLKPTSNSNSNRSGLSVPSSHLNKKKKLKRSRKNSDRACSSSNNQLLVDVKPGDKVVVETLCTKSEATVVWQDGSIEAGISSRELFPIHALDDQEFFPGDFVVRSSSSSSQRTNKSGGGDADPHSYGVVQGVDHAGRTCSVKWFRTYSSGNEPQ